MNILIRAGSTRPKGTSSLLVEEFRRGAMEMGAAVEVFSAGTARVHGCTGCGHCAHGKNACIFQDDMQALYPKFLAADLIVIATPVYNWVLLLAVFVLALPKTFAKTCSHVLPHNGLKFGTSQDAKL